MVYVSFLLTQFRSFTSLFTDERGQDLIEYALLSGVIAAAIIALTAGVLSGALDSMVAGISRCIDFNKTTTCDV